MFIKSCLNAKSNNFDMGITKIINLPSKDKLILILLSTCTIFTTLSFIKLDKSNNQSKLPILMKTISSIGAIIFGCYISGEKITIKQIIGIIILSFGLYLLNK